MLTRAASRPCHGSFGGVALAFGADASAGLAFGAEASAELGFAGRFDAGGETGVDVAVEGGDGVVLVGVFEVTLASSVATRTLDGEGVVLGGAARELDGAARELGGGGRTLTGGFSARTESKIGVASTASSSSLAAGAAATTG